MAMDMNNNMGSKMMGNPAEAPPESAEPGQGDIKKMLLDVAQGLAKIGEMVNSSPEMGEQEQAQFGEIMNMYKSFVESKLTENEGEEPEEPTEEVSVNQGQKGVVPLQQYGV